MIQMDIDQITEADLEALVTNQVIENRTLEYKSFFPTSVKQTEDFLISVSAFANTSGGTLILGIEVDKGTGLPKKVEGCPPLASVDQEIQELANKIVNGIKPNLVPFPHIPQPIPLSNGNRVFLLRITRSLNSPHQVTYQKNHQFYARNANSTFAMDIPALRVAFNLSETLFERIRSFRMNRIGLLLAGETPVPLRNEENNGKVVLHLIPLDLEKRIDITKANESNSPIQKIEPLWGNGGIQTFNLDGVLKYLHYENLQGTCSYIQLFRNGIIEAVDAMSIRKHPEAGKMMLVYNYEELIVERLKEKYLPIFKELNVEPPIYIFLTLLGVKGCILYTGQRSFSDALQTVERDALLTIPEVLIETYNPTTIADQIENKLKSSFDAIWNACGHKESRNYKNGVWDPQKKSNRY